MLETLDRLHARIRANAALARFTWFTRILLFVGFVPPSLKKIVGERFTILGTDTPIGAFFEFVYQTGLWYRFIGWGQLIAAFLLLFPRTALLGAMAFWVIMLNILVITVSLDFTGTPWVALLMLLAVTWLLAWDWDRLKWLVAPVAASAGHARPAEQARLSRRLEIAGFVVGALAMFAFFLATRGFLPPRPTMVMSVVVGLAAGLLVVSTWAARLWARPAPAVDP